MVLVDCVVRVGHRVFPKQRRLTLAPGELSIASPGSGSRFEMLAVNEDAVQPGDCPVAVQAANEVLAGEKNVDSDGTWSTVQPRRRKTKEELVQEFWVDVGFPTQASRVWEQRGSSPPEASNDQVSSSSVSRNGVSSACRSSPERQAPGSSAGTPRTAARGVHIRPWKGPLPRPRVVQPVALGAFIPAVASSPAVVEETAEANRDPHSSEEAAITASTTRAMQDAFMTGGPMRKLEWPRCADFSHRSGSVGAWNHPDVDFV